MSETPKKGANRAPNDGKGRPKGSTSKIGADVKAMVLTALEHAGGAEYLCMQAYDNPKAFMSLLGRIIPMQVTGEDGGPMEFTIVRRTIVDPKAPSE